MLEKDGVSDIHLEETEKMKKLRSLLDRMNDVITSYSIHYTKLYDPSGSDSYKLVTKQYNGFIELRR